MLTFLMTLVERISNVSFVTGTSWHVIDNRAVCIDAARVCTGVRALVDDTGLGTGTVGVEDTLWPAAGTVGVTEQAFGAGAGAEPIGGPGHCTGSTRVWLAYIR